MAQRGDVLDAIAAQLQHFQCLVSVEVADVFDLVVVQVQSLDLLQIDRAELFDAIAREVEHFEAWEGVVVGKHCDVVYLVLRQVQACQVLQLGEDLKTA